MLRKHKCLLASTIENRFKLRFEDGKDLLRTKPTLYHLVRKLVEGAFTCKRGNPRFKPSSEVIPIIFDNCLCIYT